jgi:hypothetical protein
LYFIRWVCAFACLHLKKQQILPHWNE